MNSFLILLGVFVTFLIVYFQSSKRKQLPTKLNMRAQVPNSTDASTSEGDFRSLNIIFNYNGHSFDAYQTLGVPAGSSWNEVKQAFEQTIEQNDPASKEFYLAAFNAIKGRQKF